MASVQVGAATGRSAGAAKGVAMSESTMQPDAQSPDPDKDSVRPPKAEDEGLSRRQIKWIPIVVPLAALTMLLGAAAVLGTA